MIPLHNSRDRAETGTGTQAELPDRLVVGQKGSAQEGFRHTIKEIWQQPGTWNETVRHLANFRVEMAGALRGCHHVVLTGSGSSQFAGESAASSLQRDLRRAVEVIGAGELLLRRSASVTGEPTLVVSLARSGDSPESAAVVETLLEAEPSTRHLILTCNSAGRLAMQFVGNPRVSVICLQDQVNDRSLVMTSSFTNLVLSARFLGWLDQPEAFVEVVDRLAEAGRALLASWPKRLAEFVSGNIHRIVFLADGGRFGIAREASLKLLEMTAGKIATMAQTFLALRHGPMCFLDSQTVVVCFLSSDPLMRCYELDLIEELNVKRLGARKLIVGTSTGPCRETDLTLSYEVQGYSADDDLGLLDVMVAQILGFYRCLEEGLQPDSPSETGVINRVVGGFRIHRPGGTEK